jgi:hypothetical protein
LLGTVHSCCWLPENCAPQLCVLTVSLERASIGSTVTYLERISSWTAHSTRAGFCSKERHDSLRLGVVFLIYLGNSNIDRNSNSSSHNVNYLCNNEFLHNTLVININAKEVFHKFLYLLIV